MKKFWIQFGVLSLCILGASYLFYNQGILGMFIPINSQQMNETLLKINETVIKTEVADSPNKRSQGLSGRDGIATDAGMLFVFPEDKKYQFWMKGMKFPLDLIFIRDGKVVDLLRSINPPTSGQNDSSLPIYQPVVPIDMTLEVNKGFIDLHNIRIGDNVFLIK